jgi:hypothetical protein
MSEENKILTTPVGKAYYPKVVEADTKFKPEGVYSCDILVEADDLGDFRERCEAAFEKGYAEECAQAKKNGKKKPKKAVSFPIDETEDEGVFLVKCRRPAKVTSKRTGKVYE